MRVFVTGGTGFIGAHVVRRMTEAGHELGCLVRNPAKAQDITKFGVTIIAGDVRDRDAVNQGMIGCDWVVNLANLYSFWERHPRIYREINIEGTRNVLESALAAGVAKVIHVSTGGIYGKPQDCPFTEESTPGPVRFSKYFESKYQGDLLAWDLYKNRGLPLVMIYPVGVLGPGDPKASGKYLRDLIERRLPARVLLNSILTWVHVRDVAEAILRAAEKEDNFGEKYLVGKHQLSIREINQLVGEIAGVPLPQIHLPDFMVTTGSILLTGLAYLTGKSPPWGMSRDQIRTMKEGFQVDGSKAERELGITYTPIRTAIEEAVASFKR